MDVDGVLNTFSYPDPLIHSDYHGFEAGNGFTIMWSPSLLKRITDLHDSGAVVVKWLTTWQSLANDHLREKFGFSEELEVVGGECDYMGWGAHWWKLPLAEEVYNSGARVIWTDDDIPSSSTAREFVEEANPDRLLAIAPVDCLTHADLDMIEGWI